MWREPPPSNPLPQWGRGLLCALLLLALPALAAGEAKDPFHVSGLPLPRFASLDAEETNLRTGPGPVYPVRFVYRQRGLPVEIVLEYDHWRKVRDAQGAQGWVHKSLLSGRRTATTTQAVLLRRKPGADARPTARVEEGAPLRLEECLPDWCRVESQGYSGWTEKKFLWGVYAEEVFE